MSQSDAKAVETAFEPQWVEIETRYEGWEAWRISVYVALMPDKTVGVTGLRIDPVTDADVGLRDQRLNAIRMRALPFGALVSEARAWVSANVFHNQDAVARHLDQARRDANLHEIEELRAARVLEIGEAAVLQHEVVVLYLFYLLNSGTHGVRQKIARELGVHERTVDRYLAKARKAGQLPAYSSKQARHGLREELQK